MRHRNILTLLLASIAALAVFAAAVGADQETAASAGAGTEVEIANEGFEGTWPPPGWVSEPRWGGSLCRAQSGAQSGWVLGDTAPPCGTSYGDDDNGFLIYGPFSLADATSASMSFEAWLDTEAGDYLCAMASITGLDFYGSCWYGSSGGWVPQELNLSDVPRIGNLSGRSEVWVAFVWDTDGGGVRPEGGFVDSVTITKIVGGETATPTLSPTPTRTPTATASPLPTPAWWWDIETVASGADGYATDLELDGDGHPNISFYGRLKLATWNGTEWQIQEVDTASFVGEHSSLELDSSGKPHISYYDSWNDDLKYARWDGSDWQIETVDSADRVGEYTSLALDGSDRPHVSYFDATNHELKYARWDGSTWQIEVVDATGWTGEYTSLVLDGSDHPRISYYNSTSDELKYAGWDGSSWQIETVDTDGNVGKATSLGLDASGHPRISYYRVSPSCDLRHGRWDGSTWQIDTVHSEAASCTSYSHVPRTSLTVDGAGHSHISFHHPTKLELWYAVHTGTAWEVEMVESGEVGMGNSIKLDAAERPVISYIDDAHYSLKLVRRDNAPPTVTPTPVTPTPVLAPGDAHAYWPQLAPAPGGGVVAAWYDDRFGAPYDEDVFVRRFGADGNPTWPGDRRASAGDGVDFDIEPSIAVGPTGSSFVAWDAADDTVSQLLAQDGAPFWAVDDAVHAGGNGYYPRVDVGAAGSLYVMWRKRYDSCNYAGSCSQVWVEKRSAGGSSVWSTNVRGHIYDHVYWPDIDVDAYGNSHLVWQEDWITYDPDIYGASLDAGGTRRWMDAVRVNSDTGSACQTHPRVAASSTGDTYFVWADERNGDWDIYAQRFDVNEGHRLWPVDLRVNSDATTSDQTEPDIWIDDSDRIYVVWADDRGDGSDLFMQRLDASGAKQWPGDLRVDAVGPAADRARPVIVSDSLSVLYVAWENLYGPARDVLMQSFTVGGARRWPSDAVIEGAPGPALPTSTVTPGVPGDCNDDSVVNVSDLTAVVLEIFDGDGSVAASAPGGTYPGTIYCDSNTDTIINVSDLTCVVLLIFNGTGACG